MKPIRKVYKRSLKRVIRISLESYEFEKKLIGKWMRKPSGKKKRKLQERRTAAKKKSRKSRNRLTRFRWYVDNMEGEEIALQMKFDNPGLISRLPDGYDKIKFEILNRHLFKAEDSNLKLDTAKNPQNDRVLP